MMLRSAYTLVNRCTHRRNPTTVARELEGKDTKNYNKYLKQKRSEKFEKNVAVTVRECVILIIQLND